MLVQVYGREALSRKYVYEGKETTEDEPRSGRPSTSRTPEMIEKVLQILARDRRLSHRLITEEFGLASTRRRTSSAMIWRSGRSVPDLCRTSSQTSRKQNGWKLLETTFPCMTRIHYSRKTSSREMRPGAIRSIRKQNDNRWRGVHRLSREQKRVIC